MTSEARLSGYVHPLGRGPSFLLPLFSAPSSNKSLIQEIDDKNRVARFAEYFGPFSPIENPSNSVAPGSPALFAFQFPDDRLLVGEYEAVSNRLQQDLAAFRRFKFLTLEICHFCGLHDLLAKKEAELRQEILHNSDSLLQSWDELCVLTPRIRELWLKFVAAKQPSSLAARGQFIRYERGVAHFILGSRMSMRELDSVVAEMNELFSGYRHEVGSVRISIALDHLPGRSDFRAKTAIARLAPTAVDTIKRAAPRYSKAHNDFEGLLRKVRHAKAWKDYGRGRALLKDATRRFHNKQRVLREWAQLERSAGDLDRAATLLNDALKYDGDQVPVFRDLAKVEAERENWAAALRNFKNALSLKPRNHAVYSEWGKFERRRGNHKRARQLLKKAVQTEGRNTDTWLARLHNEIDANDVNGVRTLFAEDHEELHFPYMYLPALRFAIRRGENQLANFITSRIMRDDPHTLADCAKTKQALGQAQDAARIFTSRERRLKSDASFWSCWAGFEASNGNHRQAAAVLNRGVRYCGRENFLISRLADAEYELGNLDAGARLFAEVLKNEGSVRGSTMRRWAEAEARWGSLDRARKIFSMGYDHTHDVFLAGAWAKFELKLGSATKARRILERHIAYTWKKRNYYEWAYALNEIAEFEKRTTNNYKGAHALFVNGYKRLRRKPDRARRLLYLWREFERRYGNERTVSEVRNFERELNFGPRYAT